MAFLSLISALAFLLAFVGGLQVRYIATGSMEPNLPVGSLVLVAQGLEPSSGDMALVSYYGEPLVHRVIGADFGRGWLWLSADAGGGPQYVPLDQLKGTVLVAIPYLGLVPLLLDAYRPLWLILLASLSLLTLLYMALDMRRGRG